MPTSRNYESLFSYSITRRYPYRWFTPVAIVGLVVLAVLVSILNYYSSGFQLTVTSTTNPNSTIETFANFGRWPSFIFSSRPTCQARSIAVNDQFFTNQTALKYTLTGVWQQNASQIIILPALEYYNNIIESCEISGIAVDMAALDRGGNQIAYSTWGQTVRTYITCSIQIHSGTVQFNLTQSYDYVPANIKLDQVGTFLGTNFLDRNPDSKASLWWGESCMSAYWGALSGLMQEIFISQTDQGVGAIRKSTLFFTPTVDVVTDITSLDYLSVDFRFIIDFGNGSFNVLYPDLYFNEGKTPRKVSELDSVEAYPNIWVFVDSLVKSAYSTILTDLGQVSAPPHILNNASILRKYSAVIGDTSIFRANTRSGPATAPYDDSTPSTGPLEITPSVISGIYLCSVPQRKSLSNLLISILVADFVFLQVFWTLFLLFVELLFLRKKPSAHFCQGCEFQTAEDDLPENQGQGGKMRSWFSTNIRLRKLRSHSNDSDENQLLQVPVGIFSNRAELSNERGQF